MEMVEAQTARSCMDEYLWRRSQENIVHVYKEELCNIARGFSGETLLSLNVRRRMKEYGILKIYKGQFLVLTEIGKELLNPCTRVRNI